MKLNGYLTIFLSLSLTMLLSVFFFLIRGTFINYSKMKLECAADIGLNSVLGEYHRELLNQYDLLLIDLSYGTNIGNITKLETHLTNYIEENIRPIEASVSTWNELKLRNVTITETLMPHHYEGRVLRQQVCAYISDNTKAEALNDIGSLVTQADSLDAEDGMASWQSTMDGIASLLASLTKEKRQEALELDPDADVRNISVNIDNPASETFKNASQDIKTLCNDDAEGSITLTDYYSHRSASNQVNMQAGSYDSNFIDEIAAKILFRNYLFEKVGYYQNHKVGSRLNYQIEYIIFGENTDEKNLQNAKRRIFNWRLADNIRLYFSDSAKRGQARAIAAVATTAIAQPQLTELVASAILFSWAFSDSVDDADKIFDGGKVPLIKKSIDSWENGLLYHQYLELMLLFEKENKMLSRLMDIIEMDIRLTPDNHNFRIDWCIEGFRTTIEFHDRYESYMIDRRYGY